MRKLPLAYAALIIAGVFASPLALPPGHSAMAAEQGAPDKSRIESIVKDYLLNNPEVLQEALESLQAYQAAQQEEAQAKAVAANADALYRSPHGFAVGAPKASVTMIEFFDYNCGYCKRAFPDVIKLIETDKDLKVIFKEFPILGPGSLYASRAAIASKKQNKYWEFHLEMMKTEGSVGEEQVMASAKKVGLDIDKLKADMESDEVKATIRESHVLATKMGIQGTPAFVIADQLIPGALGFEAMQSQIEKVRADGGCKIC